MLKKDVDTLKSLIHEYGPEEAVLGLIMALRSSANEMSDMALKEKAVLTANIADDLIDMMTS